MDFEMLKAAIEIKKRGFEVANKRRRRELKERTHEKWLHGLNGVFMVREAGRSLFDDAATLQQALTLDGVAFCFIGGVAQQYWGEVRHTSDLDLSIHCDLGHESLLLEALQKHLTFRDEQASRDFQSYRVFMGYSPSGYDVDIFVGYTPFEKRITERAVRQDYGLAIPLNICSAEDLVITKVVAGRGQDWVDIDTIIQRSGESMDWPLIFEELDVLLALYNEAPRLPRLKQMVLAEYPDRLPGRRGTDTD